MPQPGHDRFTLNRPDRTRHREPLLGGVAIHRAGGMDRLVASAPRDDGACQLDAITPLEPERLLSGPRRLDVNALQFQHPGLGRRAAGR